MIQTDKLFSASDTTRERSILKNVYLWMSAGLALTGLVSFYVSRSVGIMTMIFQNPMMPFVLFLVQIGLVFFLSSRIMSMKPGTATFCFATYAILNGVTLAPIFLLYTGASIAGTFFVTAGTFFATTVFALTTKRDFSSARHFLMMALIGMIIASLVNWLLQSPVLYWIITYAGVAIFIGLTIYDTQYIRNISAKYSGSDESTFIRISIIGALKLYLDFINLFILLLRIFGRKN